MLLPQDQQKTKPISDKWVSAKIGKSANWNQPPWGGVPVNGPLLGNTRRNRRQNRKQLVLPLPSTFLVSLYAPSWRQVAEIISAPGHVPSLLMNLLKLHLPSCAANLDPGG